MENIKDVFMSCPDYCGSTGRNQQDIIQAETALGVVFAKDYREYLQTIGLACFAGHELTGLTDIPRLNVVAVTLECRAIFKNIPPSWYVIEEANIDGIVIWQDQFGCVYQAAPLCSPVKIADGLLGYIVSMK